MANLDPEKINDLPKNKKEIWQYICDSDVFYSSFKTILSFDEKKKN